MKKLIFSAILLASASVMQAQLAKVSQAEPILKGQESAMFNPVLSADGQHLLFSDADFSNLRTYDFAAGAVAKVASTPAKAISARFDSNDNVTFEAATVRTEGDKLIINGRAYTPVEGTPGYVWASLSPDGTKAMFVAAGKGIYVTDLKGNVIATPGKFEAPVWFGNDHIIAQRSTDDGHQYSSSQIVLLTLDGSQSQALTRPESMTFSPAASIEAERVVFTSIDGRLYQVTVSLNK